MSHAHAVEPPIAIAEFDAFLEAQVDDGTIWELIDGHILAMTYPNATHGQIALNLGTSLKPIAEPLGCRVNIGGMRVQVAKDLAGIDKTLPDVTVWCGASSGAETWITDPTAIVEVLSPSSMDFDRGDKLRFYKSLETLKDVVVVYQDQVRVEHYRREGEGWVMAVLTSLASSLQMTGLAFSMTLDAVYAGTALQRPD